VEAYRIFVALGVYEPLGENAAFSRHKLKQGVGLPL
jgi:hypothetical protein